MHFDESKVMDFDLNFTEVVPSIPIDNKASLDLAFGIKLLPESKVTLFSDTYMRHLFDELNGHLHLILHTIYYTLVTKTLE